jgi:hypothetical protein
MIMNTVKLTSLQTPVKPSLRIPCSCAILHNTQRIHQVARDTAFRHRQTIEWNVSDREGSVDVGRDLCECVAAATLLEKLIFSGDFTGMSGDSTALPENVPGEICLPE